MINCFKLMLMLFAVSSGVADAGLINANFETGDLTGWTDSTSGLALVVTSEVGEFGIYTPAVGNYFLAITAGAVDVWQTVSQSVTMGVGDTLSGWAAFDWHDYVPYLDGARVQITDANGVVATPFFAQGAVGQDYADYAPVFWSWTATMAGTYTLEYSVRNTLDSALSSTGLFDADLINDEQTVVPEPSSLALLGPGVTGLYGYGCRRKRRLAA